MCPTAAPKAVSMAMLAIDFSWNRLFLYQGDISITWKVTEMDRHTLHLDKVIKPIPAWLMMTSELLQSVQCWPGHCPLSHFSSSTVQGLEILHFLQNCRKTTSRVSASTVLLLSVPGFLKCVLIHIFKNTFTFAKVW